MPLVRDRIIPVPISWNCSMNIGFGGESNGGQYHSIYDSYDHFTRFIGSGISIEIALSKPKAVDDETMDADVRPQVDFPIALQDSETLCNGSKTLLDNTRTDIDLKSK